MLNVFALILLILSRLRGLFCLSKLVGTETIALHFTSIIHAKQGFSVHNCVPRFSRNVLTPQTRLESCHLILRRVVLIELLSFQVLKLVDKGRSNGVLTIVVVELHTYLVTIVLRRDTLLLYRWDHIRLIGLMNGLLDCLLDFVGGGQ